MVAVGQSHVHYCPRFFSSQYTIETLNLPVHASSCTQGVRLKGGNVYKCSFDHIAVLADYNMVSAFTAVIYIYRFCFCIYCRDLYFFILFFRLRVLVITFVFIYTTAYTVLATSRRHTLSHSTTSCRITILSVASRRPSTCLATKVSMMRNLPWLFSRIKMIK